MMQPTAHMSHSVPYFFMPRVPCTIDDDDDDDGGGVGGGDDDDDDDDLR